MSAASSATLPRSPPVVGFALRRIDAEHLGGRERAERERRTRRRRRRPDDTGTDPRVRRTRSGHLRGTHADLASSRVRARTHAKSGAKSVRTRREQRAGKDISDEAGARHLGKYDAATTYKIPGTPAGTSSLSRGAPGAAGGPAPSFGIYHVGLSLSRHRTFSLPPHLSFFLSLSLPPS